MICSLGAIDVRVDIETVVIVFTITTVSVRPLMPR